MSVDSFLLRFLVNLTMLTSASTITSFPDNLDANECFNLGGGTKILVCETLILRNSFSRNCFSNNMLGRM